jgi:hypothetical protein
MNFQNYIRINPDGTCFSVQESQEPRELSSKIAESFASEMIHKIHNAFHFGDNAVNMSFKKSELFAFTKLKSIILTSHYNLNPDDKILRPVFIKTEDSSSKQYPIMSPRWTCPDSMSLYFVSKIYGWNTRMTLPKTQPDQSNYLFALDANKVAWKLPLPNIFDDGAICMGRFDGSSTSIQGAFAMALGQFYNSAWNSDLNSSQTSQKAGSMFMFKPTETSVEQMPMDEATHWSNLCTKIATPVTDIIVNSI